MLILLIILTKFCPILLYKVALIYFFTKKPKTMACLLVLTDHPLLLI